MKFLEAFVIGFGIMLGEYTYVQIVRAMKKASDKPIKLN